MSTQKTAPDGQQQIASYGPLRVIRPGDVVAHAGPVPGLLELDAISRQSVGAQHLFMARITAVSGIAVSPVHHHGESEAVFYGLRGIVTFFFGEALRQRVDMAEGEFVFIPAWTIHAEGILDTEDAEMFHVRSTPDLRMFRVPDMRVPEDLLR